MRNTVTAVIAIVVAGNPCIARAADLLGQGTGVAPPYVAAPSPTARLPFYENGPWAAYEQPLPYPNRPYTPPPRYVNPAPLYCQREPGMLVWNGRQWFRTQVQICN